MSQERGESPNILHSNASQRDPLRGRPSRGNYSVTGKDTYGAQAEEWANVEDPNERRKIQNKLAQRRFRDKAKEQRDQAEREEENRQRAGSSYASPEPDAIDTSWNLSGLPWGGLSMKHIIETGKVKEENSQHSSRENSVWMNRLPAGGSGSSRLGLRLTDEFARGYPAWQYLKYFSHRK